MDDDGAHNDNQEKLVVEEILEDIVLISFELPRIDFVEDLEKHENVEKDGVVLSSLVIPITDSDRTWDAEDLGTYITIILPLKRIVPKMMICTIP